MLYCIYVYIQCFTVYMYIYNAKLCMNGFRAFRGGTLNETTNYVRTEWLREREREQTTNYVMTEWLYVGVCTCACNMYIDIHTHKLYG